ncbi:hypothetical protein IFM89_022648 [Coptis chinensis]|uniref:Acetyl-CoA carboxylase BT domain-containing protein n=1 Tax=Coptis chinensis TaxID=261450 RepID=A0A835GXE0_9MAGN|nr:hypothetical protein IFM89_022648 [Coptis chinensis]
MDMGFGAIVMNCKKLGRLALSGLLTDKAFYYIGRYGKLVQHTLSVAFEGDTDACKSTYVLSRGCPELQKLEIRDCPFGYAESAWKFGSGMFLLVQVVLLLDFVHGWNDSWVKKDEQFWLVEFLYPSDYVGYLEKGQIPPKHISLVHSQVSLNIEGSKYTIDIVKGGPRSFKLRMNQSEVEAEIQTLHCGWGLPTSHVIYLGRCDSKGSPILCVRKKDMDGLGSRVPSKDHLKSTNSTPLQHENHNYLNYSSYLLRNKEMNDNLGSPEFGKLESREKSGTPQLNDFSPSNLRFPVSIG